MSIVEKLKQLVFVKSRIWKYKLLSDSVAISGKPTLYSPILLKGKGSIRFGQQVQIGVISSPNFYSHYGYLEVRMQESQLIIGNNVTINNGFSATAFDTITISDHTVIGINCSILDNDGHSIGIESRGILPVSKSVFIGKNVFIGDNVSILKGVTIGNNAVIGFGSVITKEVFENEIVAGNPARLIRKLKG